MSNSVGAGCDDRRLLSIDEVHFAASPPLPDTSRRLVQQPQQTNRAMSTTTQTPTDRRVQKTRTALRDALLDLMVERGWDGIDVRTLCERANVGRSTFYLHHPNKEALLKAGFADLRTALRRQARSGASSPSDPLAFVGGLIAHIHEQKQVFRALLGRRSGHFVQDRFRELLIDLFEDQRTASRKPNWQDSAASHYLAGALFQLLVWWLDKPRAQTAKDIEALFRVLSQSALKAA